jgi:uncharacterized protein YjiK
MSKSSVWIAVLIAASMLLAAQPSEAVPLSFESSFEFERPSGIAFDPVTGTLFVSNGLGTNSRVWQVTTEGAIIGEWRSGLPVVNGLSFLPNGNLLLASHGEPNIVEFTTAGELVPGGIAFDSRVFGAGDVDGVIYNPFTDTLFLASDDFRTIFEATVAGVFLSSFRTDLILTGFNEPEGITYNPLNGNLWVVDDFDEHPSQPPGTGSLYEVTTDGRLVSSFDFKPTGLMDAEGITVDPLNQLVYVAFDRQNAIGVFSWHPTLLAEDPDPSTVPEPGVPVFLLAAGVGLIWQARRARSSVRPRRPSGFEQMS